MGPKGSKKPSLHSLSRLPINLETYFKELAGESDRACALIVGAAISDGLGDLLKRYFVKLEETDINHLFYDPRASLGDFASSNGCFIWSWLNKPTGASCHKRHTKDKKCIRAYVGSI